MGEGEGGMIWENSIKTCILSSMKQIASPGWMHERSARGWYTEMTQRDGMGREVGAGSGWGTHVNPSLIHVNVWQKPLQYSKVISLQLIKIIGEKKIRKKAVTKDPIWCDSTDTKYPEKGHLQSQGVESKFPQAGKIRKGKLAQDDCKKL